MKPVDFYYFIHDDVERDKRVRTGTVVNVQVGMMERCPRTHGCLKLALLANSSLRALFVA
jgi:hypothetical protein